jgi:hypothetical protein
MTKEEAQKFVDEIIAACDRELKTNMELFLNVPHSRLAQLTSLIFSTTMHVSTVSDDVIFLMAAHGIGHEANEVAKAYNHDKQLVIL